MSLRLPVTAAIAVVLASLSLSSVLQGNGWLLAGIGAVIVVGAAGLGSRASGLRTVAVTTAVVLAAVVPLLVGPGWPPLVAGLLIVGLTAASATGARMLRVFAVLAFYVAALLLYLNLVFAAGPSFGHLIPSPGSMSQLGGMVQSAFDQFRSTPPVPDTRDVSLVGASGIALVAIMVDILAAWLRRPAIAGLPLLVLFSAPVASDLKSFGALQALTFAAGMAGYLTLLSTSSRDRLRMWGQLVTFRYVQRYDETGSAPDTRELAASGRRIGLAAVCLAVIIPLVLPAVQAHDLFGSNGTGPGQGGSGSGSGGGAILDAMLQVQYQLQEKKPQPVMTYTTTAADPAYQYFQVYVLNYSASQNTWLPQFNGLVGQRTTADNGLPYAPPGQLRSTPVRKVQTTVTLDKDQGQAGEAAYLPAPYAPIALTANTPGWAELPGSLMLYNPSQPLGGLRYTVTSSEADPTSAQIENGDNQGMPNSVANQYGSYTGPDESRLAAIAHQHTAGAVTQLQAALQLQAWLLSRSFRYSLKPNLPNSPHWLLKFLTTDRRGYCQQFAWAFAVLARLVGIPSRIAVGYTAGSPGPNASWRVTTADAHAWPELYFPGEGWLRFEPTPHGGAGQGTATAPPYAAGLQRGNPGNAASGNPATPGSSGSANQHGGAGGLNRFTHGQPGSAAASAPPAGASLWPAIVIPVLALLLLGGPAATRRLTRRRRWLLASSNAALAAAAWRELTDDLADYDLGRGPGETPRALARRISADAHLDQPAAQSLGRVVAAAEQALYGTMARPGDGLAADVARVRHAVAASVPVSRRVRAMLLPASTLTDVQEALQRVGDMLTWLDTSVPALRRQTR